MSSVRAIGITVVALGTLAILVSAATATRLSSSSQTLRATFARVSFTGAIPLECAVTLEGSLHARTIAKTVSALVGLITRATVGVCPRGSATILQASLPWHVRYTSFTGTLPNIATIRTTVTGAEFQLREPTFGITCLAANATVTDSYFLTAGVITNAEISSGEIVTNCAELPLRLRSTTGTVTVPGAATKITVTLI
jgi:hypothetical protein